MRCKKFDLVAHRYENFRYRQTLLEDTFNLQKSKMKSHNFCLLVLLLIRVIFECGKNVPYSNFIGETYWNPKLSTKALVGKTNTQGSASENRNHAHSCSIASFPWLIMSPQSCNYLPAFRKEKLSSLHQYIEGKGLDFQPKPKNRNPMFCHQ